MPGKNVRMSNTVVYSLKNEANCNQECLSYFSEVGASFFGLIGTYRTIGVVLIYKGQFDFLKIISIQ